MTTYLAWTSTVCVTLAIIAGVVAAQERNKRTSDALEKAMWLCVVLSILSLLAHGIAIDEARGLIDAFTTTVP